MIRPKLAYPPKSTFRLSRPRLTPSISYRRTILSTFVRSPRLPVNTQFDWRLKVLRRTHRTIRPGVLPFRHVFDRPAERSTFDLYDLRNNRVGVDSRHSPSSPLSYRPLHVTTGPFSYVSRRFHVGPNISGPIIHLHCSHINTWPLFPFSAFILNFHIFPEPLPTTIKPMYLDTTNSENCSPLYS
jgi:hypothetical protein